MKYLALLLLFFCSACHAASIPEKPAHYVNDYSNLLSSQAKESLEKTLYDFEKATSNQVVVAVIDSLDGQVLEDYSIKLAEKWKIGTKEHDNGVILLIVKNDRQVRIEVGYGLEGALTDLICSQIIRNQIVPNFKEGRFDDGIVQAVNSIILATKGEYKADSANQSIGSLENHKVILFVILFLYLMIPIIAYGAVLFFCGITFGFPLGIFISIPIILILEFLRRLLKSHLFGNTFSSGGGSGWGSGGGFGSGGFSGGFGGGGGGSFGGGGSSGRW